MVKKWNVVIPKLSGEKPRRAYVYLPDSYEKNPDKRYPVMYMFDGHNVFFDEDATFGKSWNMNKYLVESKKELICIPAAVTEFSPAINEHKRNELLNGWANAVNKTFSGE